MEAENLNDPLFEPNEQILDPLEWIAKVTCHIPEQGAQMIRYYGRYSNASRGKSVKRAQSADQTTQLHAPKHDFQSEWINNRRASWAALIKLIYEVDPLPTDAA